MRPTASRRSFIASAGAAAAAALAGCSGDGDSEGENTDGNGDSGDDGGGGAEATDQSGTSTGEAMPQAEGDVVVSTTLTDASKSWDYQLEEGDTVTVLGKGARERTHISGAIYGPEVGENLNTVNQGGMQVTAKRDSNHRVSVSTNGELEVEIYLDRS